MLSVMIPEVLGAIWRALPVRIRRRVSRIGQARFAVTVAAMIFDDENRILLLEHVFRADNGWGVPGGFVNKGEKPEDALRRELREEAKIELDDIRILFARQLDVVKQVEIYYRARAIGEPTPSSIEIKSAAWFSVDALPPELSRDQRKLIERALKLDEKCQQ
jgi:ADP-ribose pyrophosphatase YjhB (NUDIX family)